MKLEIPDEMINDLQRRDIATIVDRSKSAHFTDVFLRICGKDERYEADWIKHIKIMPD